MATDGPDDIVPTPSFATLRVSASVPGVVNCLKCPKSFKSPDRLRIRICPRCKAKLEKDRCGLLAEQVSSVHGLDLGFLEGGDYAYKSGSSAAPVDAAVIKSTKSKKMAAAAATKSKKTPPALRPNVVGRPAIRHADQPGAGASLPAASGVDPKPKPAVQPDPRPAHDRLKAVDTRFGWDSIF